MEKDMRKIGYSYWGFLGDNKMGPNGEYLSTPDGNAFYSWSIIKGLQDMGIEVIQMMPDRDKYCVKYNGLKRTFGMFCTDDRISAYNNMDKTLYESVNWNTITKTQLKKLWDSHKVYKFNAILHEWRMEIPGRNDLQSKGMIDDWQPDYFIQEALIEYCMEYKISFIVFDLDYKITREQYINLYNQSPLVHLFELGDKWKGEPNCHRVQIPFDYKELKKGFCPLTENAHEFRTNLVYVGNRYERDDYIDKYIPDDIEVKFYGNWLMPGYDDCKDRWPYIHFCHRAQASEMGAIYDSSVCTILLAKEEYYKNGFMTARILESLYYGCLPLFPIEYGKDIIKMYAGTFASSFTVKDKLDVSNKVKAYTQDITLRNESIQYLRNRLSFMDKEYIVSEIIRIAGGYVYEV